MTSVKKSAIFEPIIVLVCICLIASFMLAAVYQITAPIIDEHEIERKNQSLLIVLPAGSSFELDESIELVKGVSEVYIAGNGAGIVCATSNKLGYGGPIKMMIGVDSTGSISGITVLDHSETASLGGQALKEKYLTNYIGQNSADSINSIDAYTQATHTSDSIKAACAAALEEFSVANAGKQSQSSEDVYNLLLNNALMTLIEGNTNNTLVDVELVENVKEVYKAEKNLGYIVVVNDSIHKDVFAAVGVKSDGSISNIISLTPNSSFFRPDEYKTIALKQVESIK